MENTASSAVNYNKNLSPALAGTRDTNLNYVVVFIWFTNRRWCSNFGSCGEVY